MRVFSVELRFNPGRLMITRNAKDVLPRMEIDTAINRHLQGDWGELCEPDRKANEDALKNGGRLMSVYSTQGNVKFWIMTEADYSTTTVLLPSDYSRRRAA